MLLARKATFDESKSIEPSIEQLITVMVLLPSSTSGTANVVCPNGALTVSPHLTKLTNGAAVVVLLFCTMDGGKSSEELNDAPAAPTKRVVVIRRMLVNSAILTKRLLFPTPQLELRGPRELLFDTKNLRAQLHR